MPTRASFAVIASFVVLAACSGPTTRQAPRAQPSGFLGDYSRLQPGGPGQALLRYRRDGVKFHPHVVLIGFMSENINRVVNTFRPFYFPRSGVPFSKPRFALRGGDLVLIPNPLQSEEAYRELLRERGYAILAPGEGPLACGEVGVGRWPGNEPILAALDRLVNGRGRLAGRTVVVTAGPTEVDLDPARVLTNRSSGRMGFAIARACWREGADVTLIHGPSAIDPPPFVRTVPVRTPGEMGDAVREALPGADQLWMAAAVSDWRPEQEQARKLKKGEWDGRLTLEPSEDILARAAIERDPGLLLVGFAVETDEVEEHAARKLAAKGCDWLVVNNPLEEGAGFGHETNRVFVIGRDGSRIDFERMPKRELAHRLVDWVLDRSAAPATARG